MGAAVEAVFASVVDALAGGWTPTGVSTQDAERIFLGLEKLGLVAGRERIEEHVEARAQERLKALREEHGIPA